MSESRVVSRRGLDLLFILQLVANFLVLAYLAGALYFAQANINRISVRQIEIVHIQNETQICAQRQMLSGIKKIGHSLGLPVRDIQLPSAEGLDCAALLSSSNDPGSPFDP